jgi:hypothetical protein
VNSVPISFRNLTRKCLASASRFTAFWRTPTLLAPTVVAAAPLRQSANLPAAKMSAEAHWSRVSAVVERSVERAHGIGAQHSAARQQLDAAEYTLHRLIEELNDVMKLPSQLPKRSSRTTETADQGFVQAMAA